MLTASDVIIAKDLVAKIPVQPHFSDTNGRLLKPKPVAAAAVSKRKVGTQTYASRFPQTKDPPPEEQSPASADPRDPDVSDEPAWAARL